MMWYGFGSYSLALADCIAAMQQIPPDTVDAIATDPPYGLSFMERAWDHAVPGPAYWAECLRVAKPGAFLAAFGGTRTHHHLFTAIECAGWEIRDCLFWLYGTGFPKNRKVEGGRGTALKPAVEPICLARKPFKGSVEANVARWGAGALNIDACRISSTGGSSPEARLVESGALARADGVTSFGPRGGPRGGDERGRYPANLILDAEAAAQLDAQTGELVSGKMRAGQQRVRTRGGGGYHGSFPDSVTLVDTYGDAGGASRFFFQTDYEHELLEGDRFLYCTKASRKEREAGCEHLPAKIVNDGRETSIDNPYQRGDTERRNTHPAVKPIKILRWLVKLITPMGGLVLDPFMGSGSAGCATELEGLRYMGIDNDIESVRIAHARIAWWGAPENRVRAERIAA